MNTRDRGRAGESFAADRLQETGYNILARNWHFGHSEIDIIAQKGAVVAFVEVKLRSLGGLSTPAGSLGRRQMQRIVQAAAAYLMEAELSGNEVVQPRFDLFEITVREPGSLEIIDFYHMEHAYDLEGLGVLF